MSLRCGIVGLPNVGKSTLFSALTAVQAVAGNYPFTTIEPNIGVVQVPDKRLEQLSQIYHPENIIPATIEFVDIAGLVEGASRGEGLGNRFLSHIRAVDAVVHVLRCFEDREVAHVAGEMDPIRDRAVVRTELALADLEVLQRRLEKVEKRMKTGDPQAKRDVDLVRRLIEAIDREGTLRRLDLTREEQEYIDREFPLLSLKPILYVLNIGESDLARGEGPFRRIEEKLRQEGEEVIVLSCKVEAELLDLEWGEQAAYLRELGLEQSGLVRLVRSAYRLLGLVTFFTAGPREVRAWTVPEGTRAPAAAGKIHSDMERGFIRAEVMAFDDLVAAGSVAGVRERGLLRLEGRDYVIQDGDIVYFRFHV